MVFGALLLICRKTSNDAASLEPYEASISLCLLASKLRRLRYSKLTVASTSLARGQKCEEIFLTHFIDNLGARRRFITTTDIPLVIAGVAFVSSREACHIYCLWTSAVEGAQTATIRSHLLKIGGSTADRRWAVLGSIGPINEHTSRCWENRKH